mmetsp:Transcript_1375/g.3191  ORF Transcript_1375/g.3191 Transcript_1375/m.3191 type:complete len:106 (-) Transcript_1375:11-328(-)
MFLLKGKIINKNIKNITHDIINKKNKILHKNLLFNKFVTEFIYKTQSKKLRNKLNSSIKLALIKQTFSRNSSKVITAPKSYSKPHKHINSLKFRNEINKMLSSLN